MEKKSTKKSQPALRKILMVRRDKIGDFILALPAFALLKSSLPTVKVHALVSGYTAELAEYCPWIDTVVREPDTNAGMGGVWDLVTSLRSNRYQATIVLHPAPHVGLFLWAARIPYRLAPTTNASLVFYTHRCIQRRSRSVKPEYMYNLDLVLHFLKSRGVQVDPSITPPYLRFPADEVNQLRRELLERYQIPAHHRLVFIHPGSGGSTRNMSPEQYVRLGSAIAERRECSLILTAGPGEQGLARRIADDLRARSHPTVVFASEQGLLHFARHIACADLFISGSTGPLHIAGALNRPTAGFYSRRQVGSPLRWQTLNDPNKRLSFTPPAPVPETEMAGINVREAAREILHRLL